MKVIRIFLFLLVVAAVAAWATKPTDKECKKQAAGKVAEYTKQSMQWRNKVTDKLVDFTTARGVKVDDAVFWKSITYHFDGKSKVIGWGVFGMVYVDPAK